MKRAILLMATLAVTVTAHADTAIEVFTDTSIFKLTNAQGAAVYDLSAPQRLNLGQLPANPQAAEALAKAQVAANASQIRTAFAVYAQASRYKLAKAPAIVFGQGEAVVYGITDVAEAFAIYRRWKENQR